MYSNQRFFLIVANQSKNDSRKRKQKSHLQTSQKKKPAQNEANSKKTELSTSDRELLARWASMQKGTKPFIHPIRKHMDELLHIKSHSVQPSHETVKGQAIIGRVSTTTTKEQNSALQFTNFIPQNKDGSVALVPEQTIRIPYKVNLLNTTATPSGRNSVIVTAATNQKMGKVPVTAGMSCSFILCYCWYVLLIHFMLLGFFLL